MTTNTVAAPFTPDQIAALEWLQRGKVLQPYTCPVTMPVDTEEGKVKTHAKDGRLLTVTADGLRCGVCGYLRPNVPAAVLAFAAERVSGERPRAVAEKKGKREKR